MSESGDLVLRKMGTVFNRRLLIMRPGVMDVLATRNFFGRWREIALVEIADQQGIYRVPTHLLDELLECSTAAAVRTILTLEHIVVHKN